MNIGTQEEEDTFNAQLRAPQGAQWWSCGRYYKQGAHGKWFAFVNGQYRLTTTNPHELAGRCERVL